MNPGNMIRALLVFSLALSVVWVSTLLLDDSGAAPRQEPELYDASIQLDPALLELDRRALNEAYHLQLVKLFQVWLSSQAGDATYFQNGLRVARRGYSIAAQQIEKREKLIQEKKQ